MGNLEQNIQNTEVPMDFKEAIRSGALKKREFISMGKEPGEDVKVLKQFLASKGYLKADQIDSNFDENTKFALWIFQSSMREIAGKPDGGFGKNTLEAILIDIGEAEKKAPIQNKESKTIIQTPKVIKGTTKIETKKLKGEQEITQDVKKELKTIEKDQKIEEPKIESIQKIEKNVSEKKESSDTQVWEEFLSLSKQERLEKYTKKTENGYLRIKFDHPYLKRKASINDIIPDEYLQLELDRDKELQKRAGYYDPIEKDYFNILSRDQSGEFKSVFQGKIYGKPQIFNGYLIKLGEKNTPFKIDEEIYTFNDIEKKQDKSSLIAENNEKVIKTVYGKMIKGAINYWKETKLKDSPGKDILDEAFVYAIMKQESQFDPNNLSGTSTRGNMMVTLSTGGWLVDKNERRSESDYRVTFGDFMPIMDKEAQYNTEKKTMENVGTRMYNPEHNIKIGIQYIAYLIDKFSFPGVDNDLTRQIVTAAYNAGEGHIGSAWRMSKPKNQKELLQNLKKMQKEGKIDGNKYKEIKGYLLKVGKNHKEMASAIDNGKQLS